MFCPVIHGCSLKSVDLPRTHIASDLRVNYSLTDQCQAAKFLIFSFSKHLTFLMRYVYERSYISEDVQIDTSGHIISYIYML